MQRADSPASSLRPQESASGHPSGVQHKPGNLRLFPAVEPTPPATPTALQHKARLSRAAESLRRRSSSLDDAARASANSHNGLRQMHATTSRRGRKVSVTDVKPMSTVQELPLDSPTVPSRFTFKSATASIATEDSFHGRSISAPSEYARSPDVSPVEAEEEAVPIWANRQAAKSTQTLHGLGLTLPAAASEEQTVRPAKRPPRQKPNLWVHIRGSRDQPDRPPPPPPKSPRHHSRDASAHSRSSSSISHASSRMSSRAGSPIAIAQSAVFTLAKPTFVNHVRDSSTARDHSPTSDAADARERDVMGASVAERGRTKTSFSWKPVPQLPQEAVSETHSNVLPLPSSKFSVGSPTEEPSAEGDKTPRAVTLAPGYQQLESAAQKFAIQPQTWHLPTPDRDDAPPPTPRKDSFHVKKRSKESNESSERPPPTPLKDNFSTVSKPPELLKAEAVKPALNKAEEQSTPELPKRDAPKRPDSPPCKDGRPEGLFGRSKTPTLEPHSRTLTPEPGLQPFRDRPTPELPFRSATPDLANTAPVDPAETLRNLSKQTEALHARYARLRSDRQHVSTSIVSSLKDQKAGPEYVNTLLDRHLSLAAINSSMDICFAKLKSLDCRKEEALTAIIAQQAAKRTPENVNKHESTNLPRDMGARSGRSTPDLAKTATRSASKLRKDSALSECRDEPETERQREQHMAIGRKDAAGDDSPTEKRNTMIKSPLVEPPTNEPVTAEPDEFFITDFDEVPKKLRIKGAKAAKILGLMREAVEVRPGSPSITLPDEMERRGTPPASATHLGGKGPTLEVHIPSSPLQLGLPPPSPAPTTPLPSPPSATGTSPALSTKKAVAEPVTSVTTSTLARNTTADSASEQRRRAESSAASSAAEELEFHTPSEEKGEPPFGLKNAKRGLVQTIQVFVDDEILDYYHTSG